MPRPGHVWRHVIISTHSAWLPGDRRGWRSRDHRRHSSGDYRHPPSLHEHAGLRQYAKAISGEPIVLPGPVRPIVGVRLLEHLLGRDVRILALAVAGMHTHMLAELPTSRRVTKSIIGDAKRYSSRKIRRLLPGKIWAGGGSFERIRDKAHHRNTFRYIRDQQGEGAWVWTFRDPVPDME